MPAPWCSGRRSRRREQKENRRRNGSTRSVSSTTVRHEANVLNRKRKVLRADGIHSGGGQDGEKRRQGAVVKRRLKEKTCRSRDRDAEEKKGARGTEGDQRGPGRIRPIAEGLGQRGGGKTLVGGLALVFTAEEERVILRRPQSDLDSGKGAGVKPEPALGGGVGAAAEDPASLEVLSEQDAHSPAMDKETASGAEIGALLGAENARAHAGVSGEPGTLGGG